MNIYLSCYHKTGTYFLSDVKKIFEKYDKYNNYILDCWSHQANKICKEDKNTKIIHFIRNPYEIIVSGFLYHKTCKEKWAIDVNSKTAADNIRYNFNGLSYQEKLNSLDTEDGINFEMSGRSYNTIMDMYNCKCNNYDFCLNVEMEELYLDFDKTMQKMVEFIDYPKLKLNNDDYSFLNIKNNKKNENHVTNKKFVTNRHMEYFTKRNYIYFNNVFSTIENLDKYNYRIITE